MRAFASAHHGHGTEDLLRRVGQQMALRALLRKCFRKVAPEIPSDIPRPPSNSNQPIFEVPRHLFGQFL
jgi:hypothetical protein